MPQLNPQLSIVAPMEDAHNPVIDESPIERDLRLQEDGQEEGADSAPASGQSSGLPQSVQGQSLADTIEQNAQEKSYFASLLEEDDQPAPVEEDDDELDLAPEDKIKPENQRWIKLRQRARAAEEQVKTFQVQQGQMTQQVQQQLSQMQQYVQKLEQDHAVAMARLEGGLPKKPQYPTLPDGTPDHLARFEMGVLDKAKGLHSEELKARDERIAALEARFQQQEQQRMQMQKSQQITQQTAELIERQVLKELAPEEIPPQLRQQLIMTALGMTVGMPISPDQAGKLLRQAILKTATLLEEKRAKSMKSKPAAPKALPTARGADGRATKKVTAEDWQNGVTPIMRDLANGLI